uniref:Uncharacterized protein n=1 Tax=Arundo donax TaxID=35708 RepID=A0A0A9GNU4_ARUDO
MLRMDKSYRTSQLDNSLLSV